MGHGARGDVRCVCVDGTLPRRQNGTLLHEAAGNGADKLVTIVLDVASNNADEIRF